MNIYKTADSFSLSNQNNKLVIDAGKGIKLSFDNSVISYIFFSENSFFLKKVVYNGEAYNVSSPKPLRLSFLPYKNGQVLLIDSNESNIGLSPEKIFCIVNNDNDNDNDKYVTEIRDYPEKRKYSLAWFDPGSGEFCSIEKKLFVYRFANNHFYGFDSEQNEVVKLDIGFKEVWKFSPEFTSKRAKQPLLYDDKVLLFIGPKEESRALVEGRGKYSFSGGVLVGLNDADGSVVWEKDIPNAVDEYKLVGDILYVVSLHEILLIKPETGEIINSIDTQTTKPFDRTFKSSIYVDESYIYYTHYEDSLILIYDVLSLALVKRVELPEGYHPKGHNFHDENNGKQYFSLANRTQYVAQGPVLEIDPNHLDAKIEFEQEPEISINMQPSLDNGQEQELLITLKSKSLDDALRFGEIYTRDEAQRFSHNYMGMTFQDRPFAPDSNFNGVIRFVYSGCHQDEGIVNQHLRIMEKRFSNWVEKEGFYSCKDKQQFTKLVAEFKNG